MFKRPLVFKFAQVDIALFGMGKKTAETNALDATQTWTYDYFGKLTSHSDLSGAITGWVPRES